MSYRPFWLLDSRIYWKEDHCTIFAEASNLFNTSYFDFGGIVQPGRWIRGGVTISFGYKKAGDGE